MKSRTIRRSLCLAAGSAATAVVLAGAIGAQASPTAPVWRVTTTTDPVSASCPSASDCSLRQAIADAQSTGGTIDVPSGHYRLSQGALVGAFDDPVTIVGTGKAQSIIDAADSPNSRVFNLSVGARITLQNLEITGGDITDNTGNSEFGGGGVAVTGEGPLWLVGDRITGNTVDGTAASLYGTGGGGVDATYSAVLNVVHTRIDHNSVITNAAAIKGNLGGGGIWSTSDVSLVDSEIDHNSVTIGASNGDSGGGGILIGAGSGDLTARDSTISDNTASVGVADTSNVAANGGGGIYQDGNDIILDQTTLAGNRATVTGALNSGASGGGAIYQFGNETTIANSTIASNRFTSNETSRAGGGGLYANGTVSLITNSTFEGNLVSGPATTDTTGGSGGGGAIYFETEYGAPVLSFDTIARNSAGSTVGGAIASDGNPVAIGHSIIASNTAAAHTGTANCAGALFPVVATNVVYGGACGTSAQNIVTNPGLRSLAGNGGPTWTMAISATSPAVRHRATSGCTSAAGDPLTRDQRGVFRPSSACDLGAYQVAQPVAATLSTPGVVTDGTQHLPGIARNPDPTAGSAYFVITGGSIRATHTPRARIAPFAGGQFVAIAVHHLQSGTYRYRLVVTNHDGVAVGVWRTLTVG